MGHKSAALTEVGGSMTPNSIIQHCISGESSPLGAYLGLNHLIICYRGLRDEGQAFASDMAQTSKVPK